MPFRPSAERGEAPERAELRYFQFESLTHPRIQHAIFTRQGGVSPAPWSSLNFGASVGDPIDRVLENKQRALSAVGCPAGSEFDVWQVHSGKVVRAERPRGGEPPQKADGIVSNAAGLTLVMRFGDCVPILIIDPVGGSIGMAHAGWLGTTRRIAAELVRQLQLQFGARPEDMRAGIGPSIAAHHYPVGPEVVDQVRANLGADSEQVLQAHNGDVQFDLWRANRLQLEQAGVGSIELAAICTACHLEDWYSHRGESGRTGRFGAVLYIND